MNFDTLALWALVFIWTWLLTALLFHGIINFIRWVRDKINIPIAEDKWLK